MPIVTSRYGFSKENVMHYAPQKAGVYCLYNASNLIIYYGMSDSTIQGRLLNHFNGDSGSCHQKAHSFNFIESKTPKELETNFLEEYKRTYGQLPECNKILN